MPKIKMFEGDAVYTRSTSLTPSPSPACGRGGGSFVEFLSCMTCIDTYALKGNSEDFPALHLHCVKCYFAGTNRKRCSVLASIASRE